MKVQLANRSSPRWVKLAKLSGVMLAELALDEPVALEALDESSHPRPAEQHRVGQVSQWSTPPGSGYKLQ